MSKQHDDGGPAFPVYAPGLSNGMSLRDWFAGQALAGIAVRDTVLPFEDEAAAAYRYADAMLAARKEPPR